MTHRSSVTASTPNVGCHADGRSRRHALPLVARVLPVLVLLFCVAPVTAQIHYERPVEAAPSPEDIGEEYVLPEVQYYPPRAQWREALDLGVLVTGMGICAWLVLWRRSRNWLVVLSIGCLLYFGLYREGCICPIGAIQNVAVALTDPQYAISYFVIAFFFLPLVLAVIFGRVFCGGVCPFGALQDLVLMKPLHVPRPLDKTLGSFKWVYLVLAIWFAIRPATERDFVICRFDPFVGFFRFTGPTYMLLIGGGLLVLAIFLGRPYCRYLCPYGALLSLLSRLSWRGVTVTPDKELDCGLCAEACPYGAIKDLRAERSACLFCARCFNTCPRHRILGRPDQTSAQPGPSTSQPS